MGLQSYQDAHRLLSASTVPTPWPRFGRFSFRQPEVSRLFSAGLFFFFWLKRPLLNCSLTFFSPQRMQRRLAANSGYCVRLPLAAARGRKSEGHGKIARARRTDRDGLMDRTTRTNAMHDNTQTIFPLHGSNLIKLMVVVQVIIKQLALGNVHSV